MHLNSLKGSCGLGRLKVLEAEPGDYITIARKAKGTGNWFLGAITDEHARPLSLVLDFLTPGVNYEATIYRAMPIMPT